MTNIEPSLTPLRVEEPGMGTLEIWNLDTSEEFLWSFFRDLFQYHWNKIGYGILIQGGVLELRPPCQPTKIARLDGYLTVEFGHVGHLHICIGWNTGCGYNKTPQAVSRIRMPSSLQLYRKLNSLDEPNFWGVRLFNSRSPLPEQTLTIYLPNPLLTDSLEYAKCPEWSRLAIWNELRDKYLKLPPDPKDQLATTFSHD